MERYYARADEYKNCYEPCRLKTTKGTMIGSVSCSECKECLKHGKDSYDNIEWIICKRLDEALGKDVE